MEEEKNTKQNRDDYYSYRLKKCQLTRDKKGRFTIVKNEKKDKELNKIFGLPDVFVLTPSQRAIENFAAMNYLFSFFGIKVKSFSSCKNGYIASFVDRYGKHYGTFSSWDPLVILEEVQELAEKNNRQDIYDILQQARYPVADENGNAVADENGKAILLYPSLMSVCKKLSETNPKQEKGNEYIKNFRNVDDNNCSDNHKIICHILCNDNEEELRNKLLAMRNTDLLSAEADNEIISSEISMFEQELPLEKDEKKKEEIRNKIKWYKQLLEDPELRKRKKLFDDILFGNIIQGYFTYMGKDRKKEVPQDGMILNKKELVLKIADLLGYKPKDFLGKNKEKAEAAIERVKNLVYVLNMASTDYTAVVVGDIFEKLLEGKEFDLDSMIPQAKNSKKKSQENQRVKSKRKYAHLGPNKDHIAEVYDER